MKAKAVIFDLDGTLCNTDHRQHFLEGEKKDWKSFNAACADDKPNKWCINLIKAMHITGHEIVFITGRSLEYFDQTVAWIEAYIGKFDFSLYMRPDRDFKKDTEVKIKLYKDHVEPRCDVAFVVEDRKQVVDAWREIGLVCLQCAPGDF